MDHTTITFSEKLLSSGKEYISALVTAYEVYQRIAMAAQPKRERWGKGRGWDLVSWQVYSAVIAAAKLMNLDSRGVAQAIGAAYYQTIVTAAKHGGSEKSPASDIYHYAHGFCAPNLSHLATLTGKPKEHNTPEV